MSSRYIPGTNDGGDSLPWSWNDENSMDPTVVINLEIELPWGLSHRSVTLGVDRHGPGRTTETATLDRSLMLCDGLDLPNDAQWTPAESSVRSLARTRDDGSTVRTIGSPTEQLTDA